MEPQDMTNEQFAAAPDMLATLKNIRTWMINANNDCDGNDINDYISLTTKDFYTLLSSIDSAIAKAEGRAK